jgi:hypothetical protein
MKKMLSRLVLFVVILFLKLDGANDQISDLFEFAENEVFVPARLGSLKLYKDSDGFHILKDGRVYDIQNCFCDKLLWGISNEQLAGFLGRNKPEFFIMTAEEFDHFNHAAVYEITGAEKNEILSQLFGGGYIEVHQMSDGEYALEAKMRLPGGMPWWKWVCVGAVCGFAGAGGCLLYIVIAGGVALTGLTVLGALSCGAAAGAVIGAAAKGVMSDKNSKRDNEENSCTNKKHNTLSEIVKGAKSGTYKSTDKSDPQEDGRCWGFFNKSNPIDELEKKRREELGL